MHEHVGQHGSLADRLDDVMEVASRLAGHDAVGAIHVAINERPGYDDLLHYRRVAEANGLTLTVGAGEIVLRPRRVQVADSDRHRSWSEVPAAWGRFATGARRLPVVQALAAWNAGFQGLTEGTR